MQSVITQNTMVVWMTSFKLLCPIYQDAPEDPVPYDLDPGRGLGGGGSGKDGGILAVRSCPNFSYKLPEDCEETLRCGEKSPMIV